MKQHKILFKDKKDVSDIFLKKFNGAHFLGAYESTEKIPTDEIEVLSVKFSKVGKTTFEKYPNLKLIVCRANSDDMVNKKLANKYGVSVVKTNPNNKDCAHYIYDYLMPGKICFYGYGAIAQTTHKLMPNEDLYIINSKTDKSDIENYLRKCDNLILTVPKTKETVNLLNDEMFELLKPECRIISISRPDCHDADSMLKYSDRAGDWVIDTPPAKNRESLVNNGMTYTKHTAWCFNGGNYDTDDYVDNIYNLIEKNYVGEGSYIA